VRHGIRGADQAAHLSTVRTERANIDAAITWATDHDPVLALRTANGFGWAWVFLGAGRDAAERSRSVLAAAGPDAAVADRVDGLLFAGWFEASGGDLERAVADVREALSIADTGELRDRARLILAFVHSQGGRPLESLAALAGRTNGTSLAEPATTNALPQPVIPAGDDIDAWEEGAAWLLTAWAETALGEVGRGRAACDEALRRLVPLGDGWALSHAEALLGALAQAEHRFADATGHLARAADAAHRLGFLAAGSLHRANLGRAHEQNGDRAAAARAFEAAIGTARAAGDLRIVAHTQTRLARVRRALGDGPAARALLAEAQRWYATAGGGDGALLADHLVAALDADPDRLAGVLDAARSAGDAEVEVLTLDRLARLHAEQGHADQAHELHLRAEARLPAARHVVTDGDRIDVGYGGQAR
jgi:tetratricopeptide (TPR) repeat protein